MSQVAHQAGAYPGFLCMKRLLPLDGMLVHHRVTPGIKFAGTHLYSWVERATVRVKCLAQEHNTMSPARARTQTARSGDKRTNHEANAPPTAFWVNYELEVEGGDLPKSKSDTEQQALFYCHKHFL